MSWQQWLLIGIFAGGSAATIARIGEPRQPSTPNDALIVVIVNAALMFIVASMK